jgi:hypothetical protein
VRKAGASFILRVHRLFCFVTPAHWTEPAADTGPEEVEGDAGDDTARTCLRGGGVTGSWGLDVAGGGGEGGAAGITWSALVACGR